MERRCCISRRTVGEDREQRTPGADFMKLHRLSTPFWEKEAILDRMKPRDAAFWARNDFFLPQFVKDKFAKNTR